MHSSSPKSFRSSQDFVQEARNASAASLTELEAAHDETEWIVVQAKARVRLRPDAKASELGVIKKNDIVVGHGMQGLWLKIYYPPEDTDSEAWVQISRGRKEFVVPFEHDADAMWAPPPPPINVADYDDDQYPSPPPPASVYDERSWSSPRDNSSRYDDDKYTPPPPPASIYDDERSWCSPREHLSRSPTVRTSPRVSCSTKRVCK